MILFDEPPEQTDLPISIESPQQAPARIKVIGVGGGGGNAVNRMISADVRASISSAPTPMCRPSNGPTPAPNSSSAPT